MKLAILSVVSVFALAHDCGGGDAGGTPAATGETPAATGEVWEQVYTKWSCTADGRPPITFEVQRISPTGIIQQWVSDGEKGTASVHMAALYLEDFNGLAADDYEYVEQPKGTLVALDEFQQGNGVTAYHCVKP